MNGAVSYTLLDVYKRQARDARTEYERRDAVWDARDEHECGNAARDARNEYERREMCIRDRYMIVSEMSIK